MTIFIQDTSTQTTSGIASNARYTTQTVPNISFNGTSGIYNPTADNVRIFTNNIDALTIDNNQCLYGNATGLTHLQYNNIDGKPTNFQSDYNSTVINKPDLTGYATTTNLNNLSTNSTLSINNLNATSTTIFSNLNSLSTNSTLSINNLNATSTSMLGILNTHTTNISYLNATSTTIFSNLNSLSTNSTLSINNLNATSTTTFNNLNSLSTNSTLSINNLNATSTTTFNNLNSLSTNSTLSINNLNSTSTSLLNKTNFSNLYVIGASTFLSSLNVSGNTTFQNASTHLSTLNITGNIIGSGTALTNLNYNAITNPPTIPNFNNASTFISSLNVSGNTTFQGASTHLSTLNVVGNIIGSGTALTNLNYNAITNPPAIINLNNPVTLISSLNVSGNSNFNNSITLNSSLNVSGLTTLSNNTTINGALNVNGNIFSSGINPYYSIGSTTSLLGFYTNTPTLGPNIFSSSAATGDTILRSVYNSKLIFQSGTTNSSLYIDASNNVVCCNTTTCSSSLNVSGFTTLSNTTTCSSSLNISGFTTLLNAATALSTLNILGKVTTQDIRINGTITFPVNAWICDSNTNLTVNQRFYFDNGAKTYFRSGGATASPSLDGFIFRNGQAGADLLNIDGSANITGLGTLTVSGPTTLNGNSLVFPNTLSDFKISLWGPNQYGIGIQSSELKYTSAGSHNFYNGSTRVFSIDSSGNITSTGYGNFNGIYYNGYKQPLKNASIASLAGNPCVFYVGNKNYPSCLFYITVGPYFGIYLGTGIVANSTFSVSLIYNAGITNYVPYFTTNSGVNNTIMWIYNASAGVQVTCIEYWFN